MKFAALALLLAALSLAGCHTPPSPASSLPAVAAHKPAPSRHVETRWQQIVGTWYGDQPTHNGGRKRWSPRYGTDGQLEIEFITTDRSGKITVTRNTCLWGVCGEFLVTATLRPDGPRKWALRPEPYAWSVYEILRLDSTEFRYRSIDTGDEYVVRRVADGFQIPAQ